MCVYVVCVCVCGVCVYVVCVCVCGVCVCVDHIEGNVDDAYNDVTFGNTQLTKGVRLKVQYTFSPRHVGCVVIYHFKSCN